MMNYKLVISDLHALAGFSGDAVVLLVDRKPTAAEKRHASALCKFWTDAVSGGFLPTESVGVLSGFGVPGVAAPHVILVSVGNALARDLHKSLMPALRLLRQVKAKKVLIDLSTIRSVTSSEIERVVLALAEASYAYAHTKPSAQLRHLKEVRLGVSEPQPLKKTFDQAVAVSQGVDFAKEWANRPANYSTPTLLAGAARELTKFKNIQCQVLGLKEVQKLGMHSFAGVAKGSSEPLQFIVLHYTGAPQSVAPVVLVGKGITFDSGGISIKPAAEMDEMKFDMCGAASVLGVFRSLAQLQPKTNVIGLIPACENLPGPQSVKPGDVLTAMDGQTIEVLNTDAEGRLILCDALVYAKRFKPAAVVDIATLTGACVVALGAVRSGLFSNNDALAQALFDAGQSSKDLCWRMPLDEDYAQGLKSNFADVANVAGRMAGAVTAAKFLERFASAYPWAHLDIAGTAWRSGAEKGATGRPVPLLMKYLLSRVAQSSV